MSASNTVTTIDIWSSKIRTIIGYFDKENNNDFHILWIWIANSNAIRKGNILDMEEFKNNLDSSLEEAEKMAWEQVNWAFEFAIHIHKMWKSLLFLYQNTQL